MDDREYSTRFVNEARPTLQAMIERGVRLRLEEPQDLLRADQEISPEQAGPVLDYLAGATVGSSGSPEGVLELAVRTAVGTLFIRFLVGEQLRYDPSILTDLYDRTEADLPGAPTEWRRSLTGRREALASAIRDWPLPMVRDARPWIESRVNDASTEFEDRCAFAVGLARVDVEAARRFLMEAMGKAPGLVYAAVGRIATQDDVARLRQGGSAARGDELRWYSSAIKTAERRHAKHANHCNQ